MAHEQDTTIIGILNTVLKNINEDIKFLRIDFKKLNDLVLIMSIKVDETVGIKEDIKEIKNRISDAVERIRDLETSRESLELLIDKVNLESIERETERAEQDKFKFTAINTKIASHDNVLPYLWKILLFMFVLIGVIIYVTKTHNEVLAIIMKLMTFL